MRNFSARRISFLGLVLMSASAVTAAVMSGYSNRNITRISGSLTMDNAAGSSRLTCTKSDGPSRQLSACNASTDQDSSTTATGENGSNDTWSGKGGNTTEGDLK